MGHKWEIDKIRCYIDILQGSSFGFLKRHKIHEIFSKRVSKYLDKYELNYEIIPLGGMGGGVSNILLDALRALWQSKEILGTIISIYKLIIAIPKYIISLTDNKISSSKPRVQISFGLTVDKDPVYPNIISASILRLIMLKHISDDICSKLSKEYSLFKFNQSFSLTVYAHKFSVGYYLGADKQNTINNYRLIRLMKSLYIKENTDITYNFINLNLIQRIDNRLNISGHMRMSTPLKKYYLLFSTKVIADYFEIISNSFKEFELSLHNPKTPI